MTSVYSQKTNLVCANNIKKNLKYAKFLNALKEADKSITNKSISQIHITHSKGENTRDLVDENNSSIRSLIHDLSESVEMSTTQMRDRDLSVNTSSHPLAISSPIVQSVQTELNCRAMENNNTNNKNTSSTNEINKLKNVLNILGPHWVDDNVIRRYYEMLNNFILQNTELICINPTISQAIKMLVDYEFVLDSLNITNAKYLFLPVNDSQDLAEIKNSNSHSEQIYGGGSHWSLLVYEKMTKKFFYYDSLGGYNINSAKVIAKKMFNYLEKEDITETDIIIVNSSPQQNNNYDCGIFTIALTEIIISYVIQSLEVLCSLESLRLPELNELTIIAKRSQIAYWLVNDSKFSKELFKSSLLCPKNNKENINNLENTYKPKGKSVIIIENVNNSEQPELNSGRADSTNPSKISKLRRDTDDQSLWTTYTSRKQNKRCTHGTYGTCKTTFPQIITSNKYQILSDNNLCHLTKSAGEALNKDINKQQFHVNLDKRNNKSKPNSKNVFKKDLNISIFSDSQGRGISQYLQNVSPNLKSTGFVMPNAKLQQISEVALSSSDGDAIILIGGTNDVLQDNLNAIYKSFENTLISLSKRKPILVCTIPKRYDLSVSDQVHTRIDLSNNYIKELVSRIDNSYIIDADQLKQVHYTVHGFHLNRKGKIRLSHLILDTLETIFSGRYDSRKINIIEGNMRNVIKKYKPDQSTAFAHCISADFNSVKQMSAGVAKVFREQFGRPNVTDRLQHQLTLQRGNNSAAVYGLVTKKQYFQKPTPESYNNSFKLLTADFKSSKFKRLICSPMGCIRDGIPPDLFAQNIFDFQQTTGVPVNIIIYKQLNYRKLKSGYSYQGFVRRLKTLIFNYNQHTTPISNCDDSNLNLGLDTTAQVDMEFVNSTTATTEQELAADCHPMPGVSDMCIKAKVVPGVLTYSEALKQSISDSVISVNSGNVNSTQVACAPLGDYSVNSISHLADKEIVNAHSFSDLNCCRLSHGAGVLDSVRHVGTSQNIVETNFLELQKELIDVT